MHDTLLMVWFTILFYENARAYTFYLLLPCKGKYKKEERKHKAKLGDPITEVYRSLGNPIVFFTEGMSAQL
jgi:hypothetical protein